MKPILPRPVRSIIERQHVALSRCVFAIGLPGNGILPELDDRQILTICLQIVCATTGEESHAAVSDFGLQFSFQRAIAVRFVSAVWRLDRRFASEHRVLPRTQILTQPLDN